MKRRNIPEFDIMRAGAILIILFIAKEISFDRFNEKSDRIYRLYVDGNIGDQSFRGAWTSYTMAPTFTREIDEITSFVRLEVYPQQLIWHNDSRLVEDNVVFADSSFFKIFSIKLLRGDPDKVLRHPNSLVISEKKARQYFGDKDPVGQTLEFNDKGNHYLVTGVMQDFPDNSHFYCDFLLSMSNLEESRSNDWFSNSIYSYVLLKPGVDFRMVEAKMNRVMLKHIREQLKDILGITPEEWVKGGNNFGVFLQPLTDIHLNPDIEFGSDTCFRPVNDKSYIFIFSLIAFFVLLIAGINFMNLSTARSAIRAREISMRKILGSDRNQLVKQFLAESVILSLLALVLALFIVEVSLPWFNRSMQLSLSFNSLGHGFILPVIILMALLVGLVSGIYPAFYLSRYKPLQGLKGGDLRGKHASFFRSGMVILQFTISVAIIVGTLVVSKQVNYLVNKDLGFDDKNILVIDRIYPLGNTLETFCKEAEKIPGVEKASNSTTYLGFSNLSSSYQIEGHDRSRNFMFDVNYVDPDFFGTYGLQLSEDGGRFFTDKYPDDTMAVIINETAAREYGLDKPLDAVIQNPVSDGSVLEYKVVGVVKDFHHSTLRKTISPYLFMYKTRTNSQWGYISIRLSEKNRFNGEVIKKINALWNDFTGDEPFQYFFLDEELNKYYKEEERTGRLSFLFSILAISIACMGLFGLTLFNTERRMREIAIRKAMGAGMKEILLIVSREILALLGISVVLAWLIAFLFMRNWLQVFPYNIGFTPGIYVLAAAVAVIIALSTVSILTLRAANTNPVDELYYE